MKVALVHDFLVKMGGAERVLNVLADMYPDAPIFTLLYDEEVCGKAFPAARVKTSFLQKAPKFLRMRKEYLLPLMTRAIESLDLSGYDVVISSSNAFAHGVLTGSATKHVCYCHSPMRYAWDYAHEYMEERQMGAFKRYLAQRVMFKVRMWDQAAADRVDYYIANSEHVRKRIKKYYRQDAVVLYPPVKLTRFKVTPEHREFFLIVSALTPFKKIDLAVQLFNKIGKYLIVIGSGSHLAYLKNIAAKNIVFLGQQDDKTVQEYLQNCRALIFPGEEDFGITAIEAMACGKPVLAYGKGGLLESVIPGVTGEFFYEPTVEAMEDGLGRLIVNEPTYDAKKIRAQANNFSEKKFKEGFAEILKQVTSIASKN